MKIILKDKTELVATEMQFCNFVQVETKSVDEVLEKLTDENLTEVEFVFDYTTQKADKLIISDIKVEKADEYLVSIYFREQSEIEKLKAEMEVVNNAVLELAEMAVK